MRNQVRVLVGTMLEVGGGRRDLEDFAAAARRARRATPPARPRPPHGLYLIGVRY